jgi:hypothetical protein
MPRVIVKKTTIPVTEGSIARTAIRLLGQRLVSPEVMYVQRTLGASATQEELDAKVVAVRKMPWAKLVMPE